MSLSYVAYPADGVTTQYDLTFGYLSRSHVFVFVDDVLSSYRWINGTRVELNLAPDPGQTIRLQRLTDRVTRLTDFTDGQTLLAGDLDAGDLQNFYILQELFDQVTDGVLTGAIPINDAGSSYVTEQWINSQLESNAYSTQAYITLLQRLIDEEIARAQGIADEATARAQAVAASALAEATARAADVLSLTQADLVAGQRLTTLESEVDDPTTGLKAKVATLESATVDLENNKAETSVTTAMQADIDDPTTGLKARATALEDRTAAVETGKADLSAVQLLDGQVNDPATGLDARATSLESRTTAVENNKADNSVVSTVAQDLDLLEATVSNPTTGLNAKASLIELNSAVAAEAGARTSEIATANSRIDGVESSVTGVTQTQATDNQARVDDISNANAAIAGAQADATSALGLVATEQASRITEVARLETEYTQMADSGNIVKNSKFQQDPIGSVDILPTSWNDWSLGGQTDIVAAAFNLPGAAASMACPGGSNMGLVQSPNGIQSGALYTVKAKVRRWGGSFRAAGILVQWMDASNALISSDVVRFGVNIPLEKATASEYPDGVVTYEVFVGAPTGATYVNLYAMAQWTGHSADVSTGCNIEWYEVSLTPVSLVDDTAITAKAVADSATVLISSETAARASDIATVNAQFAETRNYRNLHPAPLLEDGMYKFLKASWDGNTGLPVGRGVNIDGNGAWGGKGGFNLHSTWAAGTPAAGTVFQGLIPVNDHLVKMETGAWYFVSFYAGLHRCSGAECIVDWYNTSKVFQSATGVGYAATTGLNGYQGDLNQLQRFWGYVQAPYDGYFGLTDRGHCDGTANPYLMSTAFQVVRVDTDHDRTKPIPFRASDATAGTAVAGATFLMDALATGSSSQSRMFLGVNTANNEAYLEAYAGEGDGVWNGSKVKLKADFFEFDGTAVFNQGALSAAGTAVNFTTSGTAPSSPVDGEWWADTAGGSLYIRLAGAWQLISNISLDNSFRLTGSPMVIGEAPGYGTGGNGITGTPGIAVLNNVGGVTWQWYRVAGDASIACSNTTTPNPTWSGVSAGAGQEKSALWRVIATDSGNAKVTSFDVFVRITDAF